jgi:hypothetical protein
MPSYTFISALDALALPLPAGGLFIQLVGLLCVVDREECYAELQVGPDRAITLPLLTLLISPEDMPTPGTHVHLLGLLQDKAVAADSPRAGAVAEAGAAGMQEETSAPAAPAQAMQRVLRLDIVRTVAGVDLALLEATLKARAAAQSTA